MRKYKSNYINITSLQTPCHSFVEHISVSQAILQLPLPFVSVRILWLALRMNVPKLLNNKNLSISTRPQLIYSCNENKIYFILHIKTVIFSECVEINVFFTLIFLVLFPCSSLCYGQGELVTSVLCSISDKNILLTYIGHSCELSLKLNCLYLRYNCLIVGKFWWYTNYTTKAIIQYNVQPSSHFTIVSFMAQYGWTSAESFQTANAVNHEASCLTVQGTNFWLTVTVLRDRIQCCIYKHFN